MMSLKLMKAWFDRVDHERRSPIAEQIAARWFATGADVRAGGASANFVCRVEAGGRTYALRCNHESERTLEYYAAEMAFAEHLADRGLPVARPLRSRTGALVERVPTALGSFHAIVLEAAPGESPDLAEMDEPMLRVWGATMADLHTAAIGYAGTDRPTWRDHMAWTRQEIPPTEEAAHTELAYVTDALGALPADLSSFGLIHFDLEADNMCWQDGMPGIFDFDDCAHSWFAADIAYALRDLYEDRIERIDLADKRLGAFMDGYRSRRPLPDDELRHLPLFMRVHNLYTFARLHRAIADGPLPGEAPWTAELRARLVRKMGDYREGFEHHPVDERLA
jgi:Ser/Thr protein kinase RdoA (MazF antagonist)